MLFRSDAQHRASLVGSEYRVGRCDEPHLAPASALGHGRPRAPFVSRLPRVSGRGRLPRRSPPSFPSAPRLDVGVHGRLRYHELPAEPVGVDLTRPDEVVSLGSARPHVLLHLDHRYPLVAAPAAFGRGTFIRLRHGCLQSLCACRAMRRAVPCAFLSVRRLNRLMTRRAHDGGRRRVEVGRAGRVFMKQP